MTRSLSINTYIEVELPDLVTRLELISPFIFSKVCVIGKSYPIVFELMSLEWIHEFRKLFNLNLSIPTDYRTNLSPGGDDFHVAILRNGSVEVEVYDQGQALEQNIEFTPTELSALIGTIYDQIAEIFRSKNSSDEPIKLDQVLTLEAFSAWQSHVARSAR